jgi:hypothetical protein
MLVSWNQAIAAKHRTGFARKFRNYLEWRDDGAGEPSGGYCLTARITCVAGSLMNPPAEVKD